MAGAGRISPTASLLRNSRLFSLPPPIPKPSQAHRTSAIHESETATLPYPTHAAIETTRTSLPRGDWGLKHSLPSKSFGKTSSPIVRIGDIESMDHITEFESAADLTMTLRKFQEFELPITRSEYRPQRATASRLLGRPISVFEEKLDNIESRRGDNTAERWKFKGPWLAGETGEDFEKYIKKTIRRRKTAFRDFLREQLVLKELVNRHERSINEGEDIAQDPIEISDQRLGDHIRYLRQDPKNLRQLVERFLDLPRALGDPTSLSAEGLSDVEQNYAASGPPTTHPSAGLSYLRTASFLHNHPLLGPQDSKRPVQGRFLVPQVSATGRKRSRALVGIGGVVADDSKASYLVRGQPAGSTQFDPDSTVGSKFWFHPIRAGVSSSGRIKLRLQRSEQNTLTIYNGVADEELNPPEKPIIPEHSTSFQSSSNSWQQTPSSSTPGYGLEQGSRAAHWRTSTRARPFDLDGNSAASMILSLGQRN